MPYLSAIVKLLGGWRAAGLAVVALLALSAAGVQTVRLSHAQASIAGFQRDAAQAAAYAAEQTTKASEAARKEEQTRARYIAGIGDAYERGLSDAKRKGDAVAADLRAGNLRLREQWRGCEARGVPGAAAGAGEPAASADLRAAGARDLVRAAAEADEWIRGLQKVTQADRAPADGQHASRPGN
jgi:hypothetical protein